jgi:hypothetical protein
MTRHRNRKEVYPLRRRSSRGRARPLGRAQGTSPLLLATLGVGAPGEFNTLYLSSLATPDPASDASGWFGDTPRCGHPVHGTSWAGSCWYDPAFTLNPSVCAGVAP